MSEHHPDTPIEIGLAAAIVAVDGDAPQILVGRVEGGEDGLPYGSFDPLSHRTLEIALRAFVAEQSGLSLGYVEQLIPLLIEDDMIAPMMARRMWYRLDILL